MHTEKQFISTGTAFVAGFMFDADLKNVALIRKNKPNWQKDRLNGIGGKIELGENARGAMVREFAEETGAYIELGWAWFCYMEGSDFSVDFFARTGDLSALKTMEAEPIEIVPVSEIYPHRPDIVDNLPWLVALAINHLATGRPSFVTAHYP